MYVEGGCSSYCKYFLTDTTAILITTQYYYLPLNTYSFIMLQHSFHCVFLPYVSLQEWNSRVSKLTATKVKSGFCVAWKLILMNYKLGRVIFSFYFFHDR